MRYQIRIITADQDAEPVTLQATADRAVTAAIGAGITVEPEWPEFGFWTADLTDEMVEQGGFVGGGFSVEVNA